MGQAQGATSVSQASSSFFPGCTSAVSGPLDEYCDGKRLWLELTAGLREGITKDPNLKSGEVEDVSETRFNVKRIHDGVKLGAPNGADIVSYVDYSVDKEKGELFEAWRGAAFKFLRDIRVTRTLREPLRLESWHQRVDMMQRRHDASMCFYVGTILKSILKREVQVSPDVQTRVIPLPGCLSVASEPLEGDIAFEDLYDAVVATYKTMSWNEMAKDVKLKQILTGPLEVFDIEYVSDGEKTVKLKLAEEPVDTFQRLRIEARKESRGFEIMRFNQEGELQEVCYTYFPEEPLCVEVWSHGVSRPDVDELMGPILTGYLTLVLEKVS